METSRRARNISGDPPRLVSTVRFLCSEKAISGRVFWTVAQRPCVFDIFIRKNPTTPSALRVANSAPSGPITPRWVGNGHARLRSIMKPLDLSRYIDPATNHLNGCSYLLLRRQLVPSQHGFLHFHQSKRPLHCLASRADQHRHRFCNLRSSTCPILLGLSFHSRRGRVLDFDPIS